MIVIELATDNRNEPVPAQDPDNYKAEDLYTYDQARKKKPKLVPYIAAQFSASDFDNYKFFVVGDGKRTSAVINDVSSRRRRRRSTTEFYNGPLQENTFYAVFQRAYVNKVRTYEMHLILSYCYLLVSVVSSSDPPPCLTYVYIPSSGG